MTHSAFQPAGKTFELETDYVVVGSGAGGATAAVTLARGGAKVIVVEAGPWRDPADYPSSVYGAMRDMLDGWSATFTRGRAYWPIVQGALVGGSTVINSAIAVRTPGDVFERWQRETGVGGDFADRIWQLQDELERELHAEEVPEASRGRSNLLARKGANALGYGNGFITRITADGVVDSLHFIQGGRNGVTLNAPMGSRIQGDTLWVLDVDVLRGFDARTGASSTLTGPCGADSPAWPGS